jgi:hypothetical protein
MWAPPRPAAMTLLSNVTAGILLRALLTGKSVGRSGILLLSSPAGKKGVLGIAGFLDFVHRSVF